MKSITVGSKNYAKVEAVKSIFIGYKILNLSVPSNISAMPLTDEETLNGAINRAKNAMVEGKTELGIGLEGGVMDVRSGMYLTNWGALVDRNGIVLTAGGARIKLPNDISSELKKGRELGPVMDEYAKKQNVRQLEGAIGILTNGMVNRKDMFEHVVKLLAGQYFLH